jgi:hypothetical protein
LSFRWDTGKTVPHEFEVRSIDFDQAYTVCINRNDQKREGS